MRRITGRGDSYTATKTQVDAAVTHSTGTGNPHTAAGVGADAAGTAAAGDTAHLGAFAHGDIATNSAARHARQHALGSGTDHTAATKAQLDALVSDAILAHVLTGVLRVDGTLGSDAAPGPRGYKTVAAAIAAWAAGSVIVVNPEDYSGEGALTPANGCRIHLLGATLGAITPAGAATYISGQGTVGALTMAAGRYMVLGDSIDISGAVSGVYRRGRKWVLPSGQAIATFIPADSSVIAVTAMDQLLDGNTGNCLALESIDGTPYWVGAEINCPLVIPATDITANVSRYFTAPTNSGSATKIVLRRLAAEITLTTNDANNYFAYQVIWNAVNQGAAWNTAGLVAGSTYHFDKAIGTVVSLLADGTAWAALANVPALALTETLVASHRIQAAAISAALIYE